MDSGYSLQRALRPAFDDSTSPPRPIKRQENTPSQTGRQRLTGVQLEQQLDGEVVEVAAVLNHLDERRQAALARRQRGDGDGRVELPQHWGAAGTHETQRRLILQIYSKNLTNMNHSGRDFRRLSEFNDVINCSVL